MPIPREFSPPDGSQDISNELLDHLSPLRAFAISLCGDRDYGDDLVQETLLKALGHLHSFKRGTNMRSWLFKILRNTYFSHLRRARREVPDRDGAIAASVATPSEQEPHLEMCELQRVIMCLKPEQRDALILIGAAGFSYEEASRIMGCSCGTVKSRVSRARNALSNLLNESDSVPSKSSGVRMPTDVAA